MATNTIENTITNTVVESEETEEPITIELLNGTGDSKVLTTVKILYLYF